MAIYCSFPTLIQFHNYELHSYPAAIFNSSATFISTSIPFLLHFYFYSMANFIYGTISNFTTAFMLSSISQQLSFYLHFHCYLALLSAMFTTTFILSSIPRLTSITICNAYNNNIYSIFYSMTTLISIAICSIYNISLAEQCILLSNVFSHYIFHSPSNCSTNRGKLKAA